ncbi:unnamed protein product [Prunus brigantina]
MPRPRPRHANARQATPCQASNSLTFSKCLEWGNAKPRHDMPRQGKACQGQAMPRPSHAKATPCQGTTCQGQGMTCQRKARPRHANARQGHAMPTQAKATHAKAMPNARQGNPKATQAKATHAKAMPNARQAKACPTQGKPNSMDLAGVRPCPMLEGRYSDAGTHGLRPHAMHRWLCGTFGIYMSPRLGRHASRTACPKPTQAKAMHAKAMPNARQGKPKATQAKATHAKAKPRPCRAKLPIASLSRNSLIGAMPLPRPRHAKARHANATQSKAMPTQGMPRRRHDMARQGKAKARPRQGKPKPRQAKANARQGKPNAWQGKHVKIQSVGWVASPSFGGKLNGKGGGGTNRSDAGLNLSMLSLEPFSEDQGRSAVQPSRGSRRSASLRLTGLIAR